ncbi:hypothetical protein BH09PSE5_BH09PSE5_34530 [soil metagenome]
MIRAPLPANEAARLDTLDGLHLLDTHPDVILDGLVRSAATATGCPIGLVSLIDEQRQWFKARVGLEARESPREFAFCAHAILGTSLFEVSDTSVDPRFIDNPLVAGQPHIRFYAGMPLSVDGCRVGTLCVIDRQPRKLSNAQRRLMADLAMAVEYWMVHWREQFRLPAYRSHEQRLLDLGPMSETGAQLATHYGDAEGQQLTLPLSSPRSAIAPGVLLLDDDPFQLHFLQRQIEALGVGPVSTCSSGAVALDLLNGRETSSMLLILDLDMPDMDGIEVIRRLGQQGYAGALALVSGAESRVLETAGRLALAHRLGLLGCLRKPAATAELKSLLDRWGGFVPAEARHAGRTYGTDELKRAIEEGQIRLYYQPKVMVADGSLIGVEALVRWQHPRHGLVYPDAFITVAETHGLIDQLTRAVLSQALAQAQRWRAAGQPLRVSVNISMDNLSRPDFAQFVVEELARHGVPPDQLLLEVTESRLMSDVRATMAALTRLRMHKVELSIDDFGTGHSSLAQLRDLPFDELKIDRGFVHGSTEHVAQRAIFIASLSMAHQLGMTAVAEGVEDRLDWEFVRAAGCDVAQGYFVGRPMPADAIPQWREQWDQRFASF